MVDKNNIEINVGDTVKDYRGVEGTVVTINDVVAVKFIHEGKVKYIFSHKILESQIEKV